MEQIILQGLTPNQLVDQVTTKVLEGVAILMKQSNDTKENSKEWLTSKEVQALLKISSTTIWHWENKRYIVAHQISGRKRYQKTEVLAALVKREAKKS